MKHSKPPAKTYKLKISDSRIELDLTSPPCESLPTLVKWAQAVVPVMKGYPTMDEPPKVYREIRRTPGVYLRLFSFPLGTRDVRHITVRIELDTLFEADVVRFHKRQRSSTPPTEVTSKPRPSSPLPRQPPPGKNGASVGPQPPGVAGGVPALGLVSGPAPTHHPAGASTT